MSSSASVPSAARSTPVRLAGRDRPLARLRRLVVELASGVGGGAWVEGGLGIGKSALLDRGLHAAASMGCQVFRASATEFDPLLPLRVLVDCLEIRSDSEDADRATIARLFYGDDAPVPAATRDVLAMAAARIHDLVRRLCRTVPTLIVIDDLHWADALSISVLNQLYGSVSEMPLLLVVAARPAAPDHAVSALRRGLRERPIETIHLKPLNVDEANEMACSLIGASPGARLRDIIGRAAGNPLFVREILDALTAENRLRIGIGPTAELVGPADVPRSLIDIIANRLGSLPSEITAVLPFASLLGGEFTLADLGVLADRSAVELATVVNKAVAHGVLREAGDRLAFRHGLLQQVYADSVPAAVRLALHERAAAAMVAAGAPMERIAVHVTGGPADLAPWAIDWLLDAAPMLTLRSPEIAVDLFTRAQSEITDDPRHDSLGAHHVTALFLLNRHTEAEMLARHLSGRVTQADATGRISWTLAYILGWSGRYAEAVDVLAGTVAGWPRPSIWRARLKSLLALQLLNVNRRADAMKAAQDARSEAQWAGDRFAEGYAMHAQLVGELWDDRVSGSVSARIDEILAVIGDDVEAADLRLLLTTNRAGALVVTVSPAAARAAMAQAWQLAQRTATPPRMAIVRLTIAEYQLVTGEWDEALPAFDEAGASARLDPARRNMAHGGAALIAVHRDARADYERHLAAVAASSARRYYYLGVAAALAAERDGRPGSAFTSLLDICGPGVDNRGEVSFLWLPDLVRLAPDRQSDDTLFARVSRAGPDGTEGPTRCAVLDHCWGLVGRDPERILRAARDYECCHLPLFQAQALENAAILLADDGQASAARAAHQQATSGYLRLGAAWDLLRADTRLRSTGIRLGQRGPRRSTGTGWAALTPTEVKVAHLVGQGLTNPDIARRMFISHRTVQTHVGHIMDKLGVRTRISIATAVPSNQGSSAS